MNGGLSQRARILRLVDEDYHAERAADDAWLHLRNPGQRIAPAEDRQAEPPAADEALPIGLALTCAAAVLLVIALHLPWAIALLERAAR